MVVIMTLSTNSVSLYQSWSWISMIPHSFRRVSFIYPNLDLHVAGVACKPGDAYSSGAPGLASMLEVHVIMTLAANSVSLCPSWSWVSMIPRSFRQVSYMYHVYGFTRGGCCMQTRRRLLFRSTRSRFYVGSSRVPPCFVVFKSNGLYELD